MKINNKRRKFGKSFGLTSRWLSKLIDAPFPCPFSPSFISSICPFYQGGSPHPSGYQRWKLIHLVDFVLDDFLLILIPRIQSLRFLFLPSPPPLFPPFLTTFPSFFSTIHINVKIVINRFFMWLFARWDFFMENWFFKKYASTRIIKPHNSTFKMNRSLSLNPIDIFSIPPQSNSGVYKFDTQRKWMFFFPCW